MRSISVVPNFKISECFAFPTFLIRDLLEELEGLAHNVHIVQ